jgi:hypothetical protein
VTPRSSLSKPTVPPICSTRERTIRRPDRL